jgi:hypothetical protein
VVNIKELPIPGLSQSIGNAAINYSLLYLSLFQGVPCIGLFCRFHVTGMISVYVARHCVSYGITLTLNMSREENSTASVVCLVFGKMEQTASGTLQD